MDSRSIELKFGIGKKAGSPLFEVTNFVNPFMDMYSTVLTEYFRNNNCQVYKVHFLTPKNKTIVRTWFIRMKSKKSFPFTIESEQDKEIYLTVDFWKSVLNTLLHANSFETVGFYTQTTNGLFLYVQKGKYFVDIRKQGFRDSDRDLDIKVIRNLSETDMRGIVAVFILKLMEVVTNRNFKKGKLYYKYSGFIDSFETYPVFKKKLVTMSPEFRVILIDFAPYYFSLVNYFKIPDFMQYNELLDFIADSTVDVSFKHTLLRGVEPSEVEVLINKFLDFLNNE